MPISLYEHQKLAVEQLKNGSILCGGVGSGKSRTAIAYYYIRECKGSIEINGEGVYEKPKEPKNLYIITTARKRDTKEWEGELSPFLLSVHEDINPCGIKIVVDSWNNIGKYQDVNSAFFIFDEQRVVGSGAWVKAFLKITKKNRWILLSATPGDTWSDYIPVFIANGFYKNRTEFSRRHIIYSRWSRYPKVDRYVEVKRLIKLKEEIMVNMKYVKPTLLHNETVIAEYDRNKYKDIMKNRWNPYKEMPVMNISELCYLLRRVTNSDIHRREVVTDLVKTHPKVIIFYNFDYELEILKSIGDELGITVAEWNGHVHQPIPEDKSEWIYLVQYAAGAEGWNCITTNTIIFYSQSYSYKAMIQAAGRIDRLNTPYSDLYYYHVRSTSPIDIAINRCLKSKKNFNESNFAIQL